MHENWLLIGWAWAKIGYSLAEHARKLVTRWLSMRENWLLIGWACMKIGYSLADHMQKLVTRWLIKRENWLIIGWAWAKIGYSLAKHAQKLVNCWLSMSENRFLVGWGCAKIGYSLAEDARKLVTRWLIMCGNWLLVGGSCAKIGYSLAEHAQKLVTRERSQGTWNILNSVRTWWSVCNIKGVDKYGHQIQKWINCNVYLPAVHKKTLSLRKSFLFVDFSFASYFISNQQTFCKYLRATTVATSHTKLSHIFLQTNTRAIW